ncbi:hypothetical protein Mhun_2757 [Methanospirillum hungatei JF-1]|uniref:Uncharacterized protein n=1 Tax=Methanospirillum hungatei JF-1 (strain ATCC 27890 / DSM 864 / NBRC 100397 / JF-1) TaxID=323259 RepID=Q2FTP7_METHJ|nr:hypothetical protein Mhun_2757 [Methanospirillum hungatei JF-1]
MILSGIKREDNGVTLVQEPRNFQSDFSDPQFSSHTGQLPAPESLSLSFGYPAPDSLLFPCLLCQQCIQCTIRVYQSLPCNSAKQYDFDSNGKIMPGL